MTSIEEEKEWLNLIKEEMIGESKNGMKQISRDWGLIKARYTRYRNYQIPVRESFYNALLDCGYTPKGCSEVLKQEEEDYVC